jgi:hypothetical protein
MPAARIAGLAAALLLGAAHAAPQESSKPTSLPDAACKRAVAQSRMVCVSGTNCQREISEVLHASNASRAPACASAREELRSKCASPTPWYGSKECQGALDQVGHYCARMQ